MTDSEPTRAQRYPTYADNPRVLALFEREWRGYSRSWMESPPTCTGEDIPDLIRMASDPDLLYSFEEQEWNATIEALYELGRLRASEAAPAVISLLREPWDKYEGFDEFRQEVVSHVAGMIGPSMIEGLDAILQDRTINLWGRVEAAIGLERVGSHYPGHRDEIVEILAHSLESHRKQEAILNGFIVGSLCTLRGVEAIDEIREAFEAENVAVDIVGDLEEVEIDLDLRAIRSTPKPNLHRLEEERSERKSRRMTGGKKVGRNDPCPCGSGKKYKKCCLGNS